MKYLLHHIGMGDGIICNGLINKLSENEKLIVPAYYHNRDSMEFMFFDNYNVIVDPVKDEQEMIDRAMRLDHIGLGVYSREKFNSAIFDQEFYRHANIPFDERWNNFKLPKGRAFTVKPPKNEYVFLHEDINRGFKMDSLLTNLPCFHPDPSFTKNIFDYLDVIYGATEIHCINSSFLCLIDSLPDVKGRLFYHHYARGSIPPTLRKKWKVID